MKQNIANMSRNILLRDNNWTFATRHHVTSSSSLILRMVEFAMVKSSVPCFKLPNSNLYPELSECASYLSQ